MKTGYSGQVTAWCSCVTFHGILTWCFFCVIVFSASSLEIWWETFTKCRFIYYCCIVLDSYPLLNGFVIILLQGWDRMLWMPTQTSTEVVSRVYHKKHPFRANSLYSVGQTSVQVSCCYKNKVAGLIIMVSYLSTDHEGDQGCDWRVKKCPSWFFGQQANLFLWKSYAVW